MYRDVTDEGPTLVAAFGGKVFGLSKQTGKRIWEYRMKDGNKEQVVRVALQAGRVYVLADRLACLDYATGKVLWEAPVPGGCSFGMLLVEGDRMFIAESGEVACVSTHDGRLLWFEEFKGEGRASVALAIDGEAVQGDCR